jgi:hypothetical protein
LGRDTSLKPYDFSAHVLLDAPVDFSAAGVLRGLWQCYPTLDLGSQLAEDETVYSTDDAICVQIMATQFYEDAALVRLICRPGQQEWDFDSLRPDQLAQHPKLDWILPRVTGSLEIQVTPRGNDLVSRFRAARLCACLVGLIGNRSQALAVYWGAADHFLPIKTIRLMTEDVLCGDFPLTQWISTRLIGYQDRGQDYLGGITQGLVPLVGYEISLPAARLTAYQVTQVLMSAVARVTSQASPFRDGEIFEPGGLDDTKIEARLAPQGFQGAQSDTWMLFHENCAIDPLLLLGPAAPDLSHHRVQSNRQYLQTPFKTQLRGSIH